MPVIPKKQPQVIYLAKWDHKHGQDISAYATEDSAYDQCIQWARATLKDWGDDSYDNFSDAELFSNWTEITGYNEFFEVDELPLHDDSPQKSDAQSVDVFETPN